MSGKAHDIMIMNTCHALGRLGCKIRIITGRPAKSESLYRYYGLEPLPGFEIIYTPMLRGKGFSWHGIFNFFCLLKILALKKKGMADIIYLREFKLARFLLKFKRVLKLPFVIEVHDLKIRRFYESCPERNKMEESVLHGVDGIVVLLNVFGGILKETYHIDRTPVVKVPLAAKKLASVHEPSGMKTIGYIGQLYPMQGVDVLIEAMTYLPDASLSIIGGSEGDLRRLKNLAAEKNVGKRITFQGFVRPSKVREAAKEMDVMVVCALDKGKRRYAAHAKLYEYIAMGKPVVAFDLPSIREEVTDGETVLLATPDDAKDLAEKIGRALESPDLARKLALNAYRLADEFTWEKRASGLSDFFDRIHAAHHE
jgi:glycosyltransferase involved in cell wall biosynthesis